MLELDVQATAQIHTSIWMLRRPSVCLDGHIVDLDSGLERTIAWYRSFLAAANKGVQ